MDSELLDSYAEGSNAPLIPASNLEFVHMNAVSEAERRRNRQLIRSTAMKSVHRKRQVHRTQKEGNVASVSISSADAWSRPQHVPDIHARDPLSSSNTGWWIDGADHDVAVLATPHFSTVDESHFRPEESGQLENGMNLGSPASLLGAGRVDPFRITPIDVHSRTDMLFDHSVRIFWPGFRPESKLTSAWLEKFYTSPIVMHALLFGAAVNLDGLRGPQSYNNNPVRLYHKVQTMRLMKEEMKGGAISSLDEVILAALTLGSNEVERIKNTGGTIRSPFNSPLSNTQWLNVFGRMADVPEHTVAMNTLVTRRGGLEKIQIDGLAEVLSLLIAPRAWSGDILHATQGLSRPYFPLLNRSPSLVGEPDFVHRRLGQGFEELLGLGVNDNAATVFQTMAHLTAIIDGHCCGAKPISNMTLFIDHRNAAQHSLLSLARGYELCYGEIGSVSLYEAIRHAAIIYSAAVVFPLPPQTGIFSTLATRLQIILEESKADPCWQLCPKALLWILVLGGIASTYSAHRSWYVTNLAAVSAALKLSYWEAVTEELEYYLWLESACDAGGRLIWIAATNDTLLQELRQCETADV